MANNTFAECADIHGLFTVDATGASTSTFILGGVEISAAEYVAVQDAALARSISGEEG